MMREAEKCQTATQQYLIHNAEKQTNQQYLIHHAKPVKQTATFCI